MIAHIFHFIFCLLPKSLKLSYQTIIPTIHASSRNLPATDFSRIRRNCFEIFGYDIILDKELRPWLLEVNLSPSLSCDTPLDHKIKANLIADVLNIAGVPDDIPADGVNTIGSRITQMQTPRQRQSPEIEMKQIVKEFVDELSRVNNFELIFPSHEYSSISAFLPTQRPCIDLMMKALSSTPSNPGLMTTTGSDSLMRESLKTSPTKHSRPDGDRPPRTQRSGLTEEPKKQSPITRIHQGEERKIVTTNGASKQPELATTTSKEQDMQPISILFGAILRTDIIYKSALFSDHHKGHERSALRARMSAPNEESSELASPCSG
eukprot:TRINITY_DN4572_c0_g1_i6.p1 TRINITY_DN4572_c0_g1~~TRINITY_DN4572_c0_g1_i6.p1  ORF type:complete len:321 (+),score=56.63 TRINITY_DN4572_c0_g1_i6:281-1243(+)